MESDTAVTLWFRQLQDGDHAAAGPLWERFFLRLVALARDHLRLTRRAVADEEDVALSAFDSFCRRAEQGRFPDVHDRDDLWRLLGTITIRKARKLTIHQMRDKRDDRPLVDAVAQGANESDTDLPGLNGVAAAEPTPALAALVADQCRHLLGLLDDDELRSIALWKMEGYTTPEIAERLGWPPRRVERRLQVIRSIWQHEDRP